LPHLLIFLSIEDRLLYFDMLGWRCTALSCIKVHHAHLVQLNLPDSADCRDVQTGG